MNRQYGSRIVAAGMLASCALLLGCVTGEVGGVVQSNSLEVPDASTSDAGACPGDCSVFGLICHPQRLVCVGCLADTDCPLAGAPFCDRGRGECSECRVHADCPLTTPLCAFGRCSVCPDGRDHDGVCDFDPRCSGRDCDDGLPGERGNGFGADPNDHRFDREPPDAGR